MATFSEIKAQAMELTISERVTLASHLLRSLPPCFDKDEEDAEALRRDAEMDADPSACMTYQELKRAVGR